MASCDHCRRDVSQRFGVTIWTEETEMEYALLGTYFSTVDKEVCIECFRINIGRLPDNIQPPINAFYLRTLQGGIAGEIARAMFEHCGYEVRHHGYEYSAPEWKGRLKAGDPNSVAARIQNRPDLLVFDDGINDVYEVEVKSTNQKPSRWRYPKPLIDTLRHYHPDAIIMVYVQSEIDFYVGVPRKIDWSNMPTSTDNSGKLFYVVDLPSSFLRPHQHFRKMSPNDYYPFLKGVGETLKAF